MQGVRQILKEHSYFISDPKTLRENFEVAVEELIETKNQLKTALRTSKNRQKKCIDLKKVIADLRHEGNN